jgi:tetratricopeptide (TPR) repeat protein
MAQMLWGMPFHQLTSPAAPTDEQSVSVFNSGNRHLAAGRLKEAQIAFQDAEQGFRSTGDETSAAGCNGSIGRVLFELGDYDGGLAHLESAAAYFELSGSGREAAVWDVTTAQSLSALGRHHEALRRLQTARAHFHARGIEHAVASCNHEIAATLGNLYWYDAALARLRIARTEFEHAARPKAVQDASGRPRIEAPDVAKELATCDHSVGILLSRLGRHGEALVSLQRARTAFDSLQRPDDVTDCDAYLGVVLNDLGRREEALSRLRQARSSYEARGLSLQMAYCDHNCAAVLMDMERIDEALTAAIRSVLAHDTARYKLRHSQHRRSWVVDHSKSYALALQLAQKVADPSLVAELVESARVHGLPMTLAEQYESRPPVNALLVRAPHGNADAALAFEETADPAPAFDAANVSRSAAVAAAGLTPLTPPPELCLFEDTPSALSARAGSAGRGGKSKEACLARAARAAAGNAWWWWGTWAAGEWLHWSLVGHDRTVEAGAVLLSELTEPLERFKAALPSSEIETSNQAADSTETSALANREQEFALARDLGAILVPAPLRDRLLAAEPACPLSLIVAPTPQLGQVPFALLGLHNAAHSDTGTAFCEVQRNTVADMKGQAGEVADWPRLGERAVLRLGLSVPLLEVIASRPQVERDFRKVAAVIDPGGWLLFMGTDLLTWVPSARWIDNVLTRPEHEQALKHLKIPCHVATKGALAQMLQGTDAGVLAYVGHADAGTQDVPANACLTLHDGTFSAAEWLYQAEQYPAPSRVALLGCSSSGAHNPEWLSLAPAAMWAGARIVVATSWDIVKTWTTWDIFNAIVELLQQSDDPAARLQERFCAYLQQWRIDTNAPPPLIWAAFSIVGLHGAMPGQSGIAPEI